MDLFLLIIMCAVNLVLGAIIFVRDSRKAYARLFLLMSLVITLWITSNYFTNHYVGNDSLVHIANKIAFVTGYAIVVSGLLFTYFFPIKRQPKNAEQLFLAALVTVTMLLSLTSYVTGGATIDHSTGAISYSSGSLVLFYLISFLVIVGFIAKNLMRIPHMGASLKSKQQARLVLVGFVVSALVGLSLNLVLPLMLSGWQITRFGPLATVFLVAIIAYAIVKHGLFDIRLAAVRTLAYVLSLFTLAAVYGLVAFTVSQIVFEYQTTIEQNVINIVLALILAFIFQPVKRFFDKVTNRVFFKDRYETNEFIARLSEALTTTTDLRNLLQRAATEIGTTLKAEQAFFYVKYSENKHLSAGTKGHTTLTLDEFDTIQDIVIAEEAEIVIADLYPQDSPLRRILAARSIAILMPIHRGKSVLGYLALGNQLSSGYTERDIRVLETIADELLIAIQNSLSAQEVREINTNLQQRINEATSELRVGNKKLHELDKSKDEFISMASHQLRTPLTAVKGYLSMVLEGDLGDITPEQRQVLEQAFESSQRMVGVIGDVLDVSRIQTGKFMLEPTTINIADLIPEEIEQLADTAEKRGIKLMYEKPDSMPTIEADENKLRQVMMNFIDNAIYYSPAGGKVTVRVIKEPGAIVFKVIDTGIGVPAAERPKLFTKFFRATNARLQRPDGTGIGLYMAKKVVVAHGGAIIFETVDGKGSTFGFRLPLKDKLK